MNLHHKEPFVGDYMYNVIITVRKDVRASVDLLIIIIIIIPSNNHLIFS